MSLLVLADNFVGLLIGWANVGLASFMLIGFWNIKPEAGAAAKKAFLLNVIGEVGMILGLASCSLSSAAGAMPMCLLRVGDVHRVRSQRSPSSYWRERSKSAQLPLFTWLPMRCKARRRSVR